MNGFSKNNYKIIVIIILVSALIGLFVLRERASWAFPVNSIRVIKQSQGLPDRLAIKIKNENGPDVTFFLVHIQCLSDSSKRISEDAYIPNGPLIQGDGHSRPSSEWIKHSGEEREFLIDAPIGAVPETCKAAVKSWVDANNGDI